MEVPVVDVEDLGVMPGLQLEQGQVPPVVDDEQVARAPIVDAAAQERDAAIDEPTHLQRVPNCVDRPHVVGVDVDRLHPGVLGLVVLTTLLESEGIHPADRGSSRIASVERLEGAGRAVAQTSGVPEEEVEEVADLQRQHVGGPCEEDLIEDGRGARQSPLSHAPIAAMCIVEWASIGEHPICP